MPLSSLFKISVSLQNGQKHLTLLIFFTIRRASLSMRAILAFCHFAISKIPAASALFSKTIRVVAM
jgi:hypothetical protein